MGRFSANPIFFLFVLLLFLSYKACIANGANDTLLPGESLDVIRTLISEGSTFELGVFAPKDSFYVYLGIWHRDSPNRTVVVWVANRDKPLPRLPSSRLEFSEDGNLVLINLSEPGVQFWSTSLKLASNSTEAVLLDDGNFILRDGSHSNILWQSFDHPTDTWLPGAKLGIDKLTGMPWRLASWKNSIDAASGMFSLQMDPNGSSQYFLEWNQSQRYWSSGIWNGRAFSLVPRFGVVGSSTGLSSFNAEAVEIHYHGSSLCSRKPD